MCATCLSTLDVAVIGTALTYGATRLGLSKLRGERGAAAAPEEAAKSLAD